MAPRRSPRQHAQCCSEKPTGQDRSTAQNRDPLWRAQGGLWGTRLLYARDLRSLLPANDGQEAGVIVGPEMDFRVLDRLSDMACNFRLCEEVGVVCEKHPCSGELS